MWHLRSTNLARSFRLKVQIRTHASAQLASGFSQLQAALDSRIVGHRDLKEAILLALVSREHVYVEGPPGTAKTQMAETAARAAGLKTFVYQLHRDTRLHELVGDTVIVRAKEETGVETIKQSLRPGGILSAEVAVLDDISRAPGEALNVLFRVLNERRFCMEGGDAKLPLVTAIATGNPCGGVDEYYAEPLDPATLDRFTLHVRAGGLIETTAWDDVLRVIALHSGGTSESLHGHNASSRATVQDAAATLAVAHQQLKHVVFEDRMQRMLVHVLQIFVKEVNAASPAAQTAFGVSGGHLLTDRTFLAKGPLICRAHALIHGRAFCTDEDLRALRHLTAFRLPASVQSRVDDIIEEVIRSSRSKRGSNDSHGSGSNGEGGGGNNAQHASTEKNNDSPAPDSGKSAPRLHACGSMMEVESKSYEEVGSIADTEQWEVDDAQRGNRTRPSPLGMDTALQPLIAAIGALESILRWCVGLVWQKGNETVTEVAQRLVAAGHVTPLVSAISGRMRRRARKRSPQLMSTGGSVPRGWRIPQSLHAWRCSEVDAADAALWVQDPTPRLPRVIARQASSDRGGRLAILRDVSASMDGPHAVWASAVVSHLLQMCQQRSLSVGYLEFNHEPMPLRGASTGNFFMKEYDRLRAAAKHIWGDGGTNLQFALRAVLCEYGRVPTATHDIETLRSVGRQLYNGLVLGKQDGSADRDILSESDLKLPRQVARTRPSETCHALLVTDGVPTLGCMDLIMEQREARALGLCVHTVFIGDAVEYPQTLASLARATGGVCFQAIIDDLTGKVQLLNRAQR